MKINDSLSELLSGRIDSAQKDVFGLANRPVSLDTAYEDEIFFKLAMLEYSTAFNAYSTNSDFKFNVTKRIIDGF